MIIRPRPHPLELLFILRGSIVRDIAPKVLAIMALSAGVVALADIHRIPLPDAGTIPFSIIGLALSVFLGFRNNACYDRWWEARKHLGDLVVQTRAFAREAGVLLPDETLRRRLVHAAIGFTHALTASLRGQDAHAAARTWLPEPLADRLQSSQNLPDAILRAINVDLRDALQSGALSDILYQTLSQRLLALTAIQAACERIRHTPMPFAYALLLHRTAWLFCLLLPFGLASGLGWMTPFIVMVVAYTFFGLDALGDQLEEPFGLQDHGLPLDALARIIEIDFREGLGEKDLPERLQPVEYLLL